MHKIKKLIHHAVMQQLEGVEEQCVKIALKRISDNTVLLHCTDFAK